MVKMVSFYVVYILTNDFFFLSERWTLSWWCHLLSGWKPFYVLCGDWWRTGFAPRAWTGLLLPWETQTGAVFDFICCCCWVWRKSHCPFKSCLSLAQDWPWDPLHAPHSSSSWVAGWWHSPSRLSSWSLSIPVAETSPTLPFSDLDMLGLFQPCQVTHVGVTHTGINLPVNVK